MKKVLAAVIACLLLFTAGCAEHPASPTTTPTANSVPTTHFTTAPTTIPTVKPTPKPTLGMETLGPSFFKQYNIWYHEVTKEIRWDSDAWGLDGWYDDVRIFYLDYPEIHLKKNHTKAQAAVAADLNNRIDKFLLESEEWIDEAIEDSVYYGYFCRDAIFDIRSIEECEDQQIISLHYIISTSLGGPHPNSPSYQITYDSVTGEILMLDDIIDTKKADALYQKVCDNLPTDIPYDGEPTQIIKERFFTDLSKTDNWALGEKGLTFTFNTYVLATHAYGIIDVVIPYNDLTDILLPQYMPK